ncbi:YfcC family protein [Proteiniclasticum sp. BAD-10]|uniref:YfcC family protein n=2 Tax=Proteiniclasticum sediminis TaxID=2804028 RepID=A0A941HR03_9CLOT|nr:YfcC family protein [Proteiniclasticum sediminis]
MSDRAGIKISRKSFFSSMGILLFLMVLVGVLTKTIPAGVYQRVITDGRETIVPGSFRLAGTVDYPIYRWFLAPLEVLRGSDSAMIIVIILFLLFIGSAFTLLDGSGILRYMMETLVSRFSKKKYLLMGALILFFMLFGALFGIFEELIVLVPLAIALSYSFGWDSLVGLGFSAMASGFGFAAAIFNPFTLGVAQTLAGLPPYSGTAFRVLIFITLYLMLYGFLAFYARRIEKNPERSSVYNEDREARRRYQFLEEDSLLGKSEVGKAAKIFGGFMGGILLLILLGFFVPALSSVTLPLVAVIFLTGGIVSALTSGYAPGKLLKNLFAGFLGMLPAVVLILMAMSIKHIMTEGKVMDSILYYTSGRLADLGANEAVAGLFFLILFLDFFIGSGSAKAFLVMPILLPLTDMVGLTRQTAVLAFCFGDGFSNLMFPTNPTLMIALGLTVVSYPKWMRWSLKFQAAVFIVALGFLFLANRMAYGPF